MNTFDINIQLGLLDMIININKFQSKDNYADSKVMSNYAKLALAFLAEVAKGDIKVDGETQE